MAVGCGWVGPYLIAHRTRIIINAKTLERDSSLRKNWVCNLGNKTKKGKIIRLNKLELRIKLIKSIN